MGNRSGLLIGNITKNIRSSVEIGAGNTTRNTGNSKLNT